MFVENGKEHVNLIISFSAPVVLGAVELRVDEVSFAILIVS